MLDEKRVILMTKMASYEGNEGKKALEVTKYFFSDYCISQLIKSFICSTISFVLVLALYIMYNADELMSNVYQIDLLAYGKGILKYYLLTVVIYGILCYFFGALRYIWAKKSLKVYYHNLKRLGSMTRERSN